MELKEYFGNTKGRGVLATADSQGKTDAAVFARPHVMDDGTLAFIMPDRLTHHNLQENDHATYLFMEEGREYKGKRLFLIKIREKEDPELIQSLSRRKYAYQRGYEEQTRYVVFFKIDKVLPLIGAGDEQ